ncbi:hypothetical protein Raf01_96640 [Rugosimonospora africana]|uniref:Uncharacterized protein n=1 Tax=Rugosimonospora africana TaxID=556532 RepID=A0A8J3VW86_9ACTN|nr:hypothetical protein Raf01_96640 [Rugosimonospora africana]
MGLIGTGLSILATIALGIGSVVTVILRDLPAIAVCVPLLPLFAFITISNLRAQATPQHALPPPPTLKARLGDIRESLGDIGRVLGELDTELAARLQALEESQTRLERYERLATLTPDQREAIDQFFDQRLAEEGKRSGRRDLTLFSLGLLFAIPIGLLVNWASVPVWQWLTR